MLDLSSAEARALITGEVIVAFAQRGAVTEGDEVALESTSSVPDGAIKPAYRRWNTAPIPAGHWSGVVISVDPSTVLDPDAGQSRHVRTETPSGDLVVLRVYGPDGPVLSDHAFAARQKSVEGALRS